MSQNNRRGPRVMHGGHRLLAQARALGAAEALARPAPLASPPKDAVAAMVTRVEAEAMVRRLRVAEVRVAYVERCLAQFEAQAAKAPEGHPLRLQVEAMCKTLRELLAAAEKDVPV